MKIDRGGVESPPAFSLSEKAGGDGSTAIDELLEKVYLAQGIDFRGYKLATIERRLARRLVANRLDTYDDYARLLDAQPQEYSKLLQDLTIKVSSFFRNPETFQLVQKDVLPDLIATKRRRGEKSLRFWSAGCAEGEEVYSLAILVAELLGDDLAEFEVVIHGTDVDARALEKAEKGEYSAAALDNVSSERLGSCFECSNPHRASRRIRALARFSYDDLTREQGQPFAEGCGGPFDGILCRNVLIYFQRPLQHQVVELLHRSLAEGGFLLLGEAESIPFHLNHQFDCLNKRARIYRKR